MHTHPFSEAQAAHALEVVLTLMKKRRFFLFRQDDDHSRKIWGDLDHELDLTIFRPALELDEKIRNIYSNTARTAERTILSCERELGLKEPDLTNKQLARCNRYTGGLDICQVYPTAAFLEYAPATIDELQAKEMVRLLAGNTPDDYSPKELEKLQAQVHLYGSRIWAELAALRAVAQRNSCVVLLRTRFHPTFESSDEDLMGGRLDGIPLFPHALGYLVCEYSKQSRIVRHNFAIFSTSNKAHVEMEHWGDKKPSLKFDVRGGYSCEVYVPIVL